MRRGDAARFALGNLRKRRLRTVLTAAGVMIGIGALVSMLSFGTGMQRNVTEAFEASDLLTSLTVLPADAVRAERGPAGRRQEVKTPGKPASPLDDGAVERIRRLAGVRTAYPDVNFPALAGLGDRSEFRLVGVVPAEVAGSKSVRIGWGRGYAADDEESAVVSQSLLRQLGVDDPGAALGRKLRLSSISFDFRGLNMAGLSSLLTGEKLPVAKEDYEFAIVGVTSASGFGGPSPFQNDILIPPVTARRIKRLPITSVWDLFRVKDGLIGYSAVNVRLVSAGDLPAVKDRVREMGFSTFALADQFEQITRGFVFMDMILAAVGMIAIVVAALGIVNTMVMSILERSREIGIMKAVGARDADIQRIFFFESGAIGLLGGLFGCGLGWAVSQLINKAVNYFLARQGMPFIEYFGFPAWIFIGAVGFSVLVSLVSGIYPALRASRLDPVVALRHD